MKIRSPAVSGTFYPLESPKIRELIKCYLNQAKDFNLSPRALIAPHAGYIYSGPIAGSAYKQIESLKGKIERVVLLGPAHRVPLDGIAFSSHEVFETPLGKVKIDQKTISQVSKLSYVGVSDEAHELEHSLEVHLPFLQVVLGEFELIPGVVGECSKEKVAEFLDRFWDNPSTLIVISTDLSHYHPYSVAQKVDEKTAQYIENMNSQGIRPERACGAYPLTGLLDLAKSKGAKVSRLDVRNSGDTEGDKDHVVGYGAFSVQ